MCFQLLLMDQWNWWLLRNSAKLGSASAKWEYLTSPPTTKTGIMFPGMLFLRWKPNSKTCLWWKLIQLQVLKMPPILQFLQPHIPFQTRTGKGGRYFSHNSARQPQGFHGPVRKHCSGFKNLQCQGLSRSKWHHRKAYFLCNQLNLILTRFVRALRALPRVPKGIYNKILIN